MPAKRKAGTQLVKKIVKPDRSVAAPSSSSAQTYSTWAASASSYLPFSWSYRPSVQASFTAHARSSLWPQTPSSAAQTRSSAAAPLSSAAQTPSSAAQTSSSAAQNSSSSAGTPAPTGQTTSSLAQDRSSSVQPATLSLVISHSSGLVLSVPLPPVRPSSRETLPPYKEGLGDTWPKGPNGWRRVLKSYEFYSLLCENTKTAWTQAIQLVKNSKTDEKIDCTFVRNAAPFTKWLYGDWPYRPSIETAGDERNDSAANCR